MFDAKQDGSDAQNGTILKSQMEALLQFGNPAGPIDLDEQQAQQSEGQKILSCKLCCSIFLLVQQTQMWLEQPQVCFVAV